MRTTSLAFLFCLTFLPQCGPLPLEGTSVQAITSELCEGSPEAVGILSFLNSQHTTIALLDHKVPLNSRAANNIVAHRNGRDSLFGTADDHPFTTLDQVDHIPWVGPVAFEQLLQYALQNGWVPVHPDEPAVWDGVPFNPDEETQTLSFTNRASHAFLDHGLELDRRAATSIVNAQPLQSMSHLASLYYVGEHAMRRLKESALHRTEEDHRPRETSPTPFEDQFNHDQADEIPPNSSGGLITRVNVLGVPNIRVDVLFAVGVLHSEPSEIQFELVNPHGESWSFTSQGRNDRHVLGEMQNVNGEWTLRSVDTVAGTTGELWGWALEIKAAEEGGTD